MFGETVTIIDNTIVWQYKVVNIGLIADPHGHIPDELIERTLNIYGEDRWELVTLDMQQGIAVFKRPNKTIGL